MRPRQGACLRSILTAYRPLPTAPTRRAQTKDFAADDVGGQCEQVMANMGAILAAAGSSFGKVVKTTILLEDMADFATVNAVYGKFFPEAPPARATFAVKGLPLGAKVEIDAVALL